MCEAKLNKEILDLNERNVQLQTQVRAPATPSPLSPMPQSFTPPSPAGRLGAEVPHAAGASVPGKRAADPCSG